MSLKYTAHFAWDLSLGQIRTSRKKKKKKKWGSKRHFKFQVENYEISVCLFGFMYVSVSHFSCSIVSDSLQPHGLQHASPHCLSPTPRAYSNSCPLSQWCHPTISSSVVPFSFCLQSSPTSGSFPMSLFFASGGQSIGVSALATVLPMNIEDWSPLGWTGWISLSLQGTLKSLLQHHSSKT